jgi:hypothetical protein
MKQTLGLALSPELSIAKGFAASFKTLLPSGLVKGDPALADETAAPSHESLEREAARQTRSL